MTKTKLTLTLKKHSIIKKGVNHETPNQKILVDLYCGFDAYCFDPTLRISMEDEYKGIEILEEVPFTLELEEGDLPLSQLSTAKLSEQDLPDVISASLAEERGHVNRLYEQEPDDYTVMFQNKDASKTIYVFSTPVKNTSGQLNTASTI